ncbi:hypothetical protein [Aphanothece sacrum]|uniref:Uncharacterized protein n=1 Tax=Aphanothece sacrum FPU1 TaxID=1920663 RepID=A0A401IJS1_APHSA|nr:hypothetical protein [Aphanothece sacrum]GBF81552.1 hypothetical protein AsFPU1_2966 [Aphanothece sacrum FPU1]
MKMNLTFFKTTPYLILSTLITFCTLGISPSMAQVKDTQVNKLVEAIRKAAPLNKPKDGMYSDWQVLPGIIPDWTKRCLGKSMTVDQFEADKKAAQKTVTCIVQREFETQFKATKNEMQAVKNTACWWMTGKIDSCKNGTTGTSVEKVLTFYKK